jgi:amino acid transporter
MLDTALPRSGGDYVFQSRIFGKIGFSIVMSGFVIWILQWVALSGWLLSYLGFASLFLGLGGTMSNPSLTAIGVGHHALGHRHRKHPECALAMPFGAFKNRQVPIRW